MFNQLWIDLGKALLEQLKPRGYCGHLLSQFDTKKTLLENMIKQTALRSESNSILITGPSGSGKSALLECVLEKVLKDRAISENMLQVWLDGLIHIDDNIALEDITRQLKLREVEDRPSVSFSEKLRLLLVALKGGTKESKSVLFVLKNFELFSSHKNQTLLYNLFDIAQSQQTPICVVGLCSRPDVLQVLENRVNSRFSHQQILLFDEITLEDYMDSAEYFLSLHSFKDSRFQKRWNSDISSLLKETTVKSILEKHFIQSTNLRDLKNLLYIAIQNMFLSKDYCIQPKLVTGDMSKAYEKIYEDGTDLILDLSVLEVALVIAMTHLTEIYDGEAFNFEIIFNELGKFLRNRMKWNIEKSVVKKSFEHLLHMKLVKPVSDFSNDTLNNYMLVRLGFSTEKVRRVLKRYPNLPAELKNWIESS